jgi:hypothetical protein
MTVSYGPGGGFAQASDGSNLDLNTLAHSYSYNTDGTLATDTVVLGSNTYIKTYLYTSGNLTSESVWVKQ